MSQMKNLEDLEMSNFRRDKPSLVLKGVSGLDEIDIKVSCEPDDLVK